jgi:hypothetical protein
MAKWLPFRRVYISKLKEENVVKPPQNPTPRSNMASVDNQLFLRERPNIIPSSRHPMMLTRKVPRYRWVSLELKYELIR